ncbi:30S ribosomal protein S9 [Methanocella sp. CWC-04]|uniref:Small ribosomal subunit protein uS9 n=1 Tax=Methanooceanicella nereidis TaxID=2052831 RepID=A0AAP2W464_9EURY|nr:30S ribosomal protein S9 [Methanocella sp. CWC-04]MCD1293895.1 30S ribosomal protein S9 [Methanocella sp. CWC-04]
MVKVLTTSGKRKTAIARAVVKKGTGVIRINKQLLKNMENELLRLKISEPLLIAGPEIANSFDIDVDVRGGGIMGQAEAARCAISRGIVNWTNDVALRDAFLTHDRNLLVNDVRQKESKKYGGPGARAKIQKSYR